MNLKPFDENEEEMEDEFQELKDADKKIFRNFIILNLCMILLGMFSTPILIQFVLGLYGMDIDYRSLLPVSVAFYLTLISVPIAIKFRDF